MSYKSTSETLQFVIRLQIRSNLIDAGNQPTSHHRYHICITHYLTPPLIGLISSYIYRSVARKIFPSFQWPGKSFRLPITLRAPRNTKSDWGRVSTHYHNFLSNASMAIRLDIYDCNSLNFFLPPCDNFFHFNMAAEGSELEIDGSLLEGVSSFVYMYNFLKDFNFQVVCGIILFIHYPRVDKSFETL